LGELDEPGRLLNRQDHTALIPHDQVMLEILPPRNLIAPDEELSQNRQVLPFLSD
jgi:hypothetical protein